MVAIQRYDMYAPGWAVVTEGEPLTGISGFSVSEGSSGNLVLSWMNRYGENETYESASRQDALKKAAEVTGFSETDLRIR